MSRRAATPDFDVWLDSALAGTGWTAATLKDATGSGRDDLVTAALAAGFAAAERGLTDRGTHSGAP